jgi:NAD(P)-dependent dehydrogenase (short-subunit alcohol dehydrogenase family)
MDSSSSSSLPSSTPPATSAPVVLVTGAAKRLGRAIALGLAASGWRVAVHYRSSTDDALKTVADCASKSWAAHAFDCDLEDEGAVRALVPRVVAHFGQLDAVVNSASTFEQDDASSFGFAALDKHLRANTGAPILLAQALFAHLAERHGVPAITQHTGPGAVVVNLLDQKLWNQNPDFLSYTLSKAALECACTQLAMALAPAVRVVGVAPGLTLTSHLLTDAQFEALHKLSPLGCSSTVEDVVATVKFAIDNRSITGTTLLVDGGQHLMKFQRDFSLMSAD